MRTCWLLISGRSLPKPGLRGNRVAQMTLVAGIVKASAIAVKCLISYIRVDKRHTALPHGTRSVVLRPTSRRQTVGCLPSPCRYLALIKAPIFRIFPFIFRYLARIDPREHGMAHPMR